jgi:hypothetical protein
MSTTAWRMGGAPDPAAPLERHRVFPASPASIPVVRRMVAEAVPDPVLAATAELLISEVATNAVRHAATPFEVSIWVAPTRLRAEVVDASTALPIIRTAGSSDERGRGLHIVDALASAWGVESRGQHKAVWFELCFASHGRARRAG